MTSRREREAEDAYEEQNDPSPVEASFADNSYIREPRQEIRERNPVQGDEEYVDDPMQPPYSNSNEQLADDEREAIDRNNVLEGDRLRHAKPQSLNQYSEGPAEDALPDYVRYGESGRSGTKRLT